MSISVSSTIGADDTAEPFPLTEIQYAYWVGRGSSFVLGNVAPHAYFELEGRRLEPAVLGVAWNRLIARHGMLRAVVGEDGQQRILPDVPEFEIGFVDLSTAPKDEVDATLAAIREEMSHRVYIATDWPLFDIRISRLPQHDRLHISLDLLMVDLASVALLFSEWWTLCENSNHVLEPVDVSFRDYVRALEDMAGSRRHQQSLSYWTSRAQDLAPPPDLPLERSPVGVHKPRFSHREFYLPQEDWKRLQGRAEVRGLTPTAVLATAFAEVLAAWSGTLRFTLNLTLFNRLPLVLAQNDAGHRILHPHLRRVVGDFTSICLLEMDNAGGVPFEERVRRTQRQLQQDLRHRYVSALHTLRERRRRGLQNGFETMPVVFTSGLGTVADISGPRDYFGDITYRISQTPQVWLDHQVMDITGSLDLTWDAVEELFPEALLDDMFATYCALVEQLATDDASWSVDLAVLAPQHQLMQRERANNTEGPVPEGLLHAPLLRTAAEDPARIAVVTSTGSLTYGEFARRAAAIAAELSGNEPLRDRLVGIVLNKGPDQVAAAVGVMLAGGAYLPVDPALPVQRRRQILADGAAVAVITDTEIAVGECDGIVRRLFVDELPDAVALDDTGPAQSADLAYVIFTSGSTGTPKGVMIEHTAALNTVVDINERFGVDCNDRVLGLADLGFDLSVYDVFGTLAVGATLVLPDQDKLGEPAHWVELMNKHRVTVWNSVPAQMQMLVEHLEAGADRPLDLRLVMLSGDWIPVDLPDRIHALCPDARVISLGGATEASIWSIYHEIESTESTASSVPYGVPLRNQRFHVLDQRLGNCPVWTAGELYIEGHGLARGYWGDPDKTAASFITHPVTGVRLYRTGDFGRYLSDGTIQFLGRRDGQVKINGHRVELGEIEAVLTQYPGVERAVAVKSADEFVNAKLLAYIVPAKDDSSLFVTEHADQAHVDRVHEEMCRLVGEPVPDRPTPQDLRAVWDRLNEVYLAAAAAAFRALDMPYASGEKFDPALLTRSAGVAPRYERWINRAVAELVRRGALRAGSAGLEVVEELPLEIPAEVCARARQVLRDILDVPDRLIDWLLSLATNLASVLTQSSHSAELYTNDQTPAVYEQLFGPTYQVATEAVRQLVASWPQDRTLRVLEVGAGFGSLTKRLLPLLPADRTEYLFTDISMYFIDQAKEAFAEHEFVSYGLFNLDSPPEIQGLDDQAADLLIAASVLHDTTHLRRTLSAIRSVLAPGGLLLLVEQTVFHPWFDLTMGLQQGFDGFADIDLRTGHPLLDREQWAMVLEECGYTGTTVLTVSGGPGSVGFDVLVACAPAERRRFAPEQLREFASERLPSSMMPSRILALDELPQSSTGKVDRAALARASARSSVSGRPAKPPRTDRQHKLVEIWRSVLGLRHVDLADDFLEAGGDSLLAARLAANIRSAFDVTVPVSTILEYPTVETLDCYLEQILGQSALLVPEGEA
jgi:pyochelin synthetase